jgi:4-amino-4-deoxychorismate lyase
MKEVVLINGKQQSTLSVFNRLIQFGDGLFETCVAENTSLLFWSQHFERLEKGRIQLKINPVSEKVWLEDISAALRVANMTNAVVKIILSRGESRRGYGFEEYIKPTRLVIVSMMLEVPSEYTLSICHSGYANNQLLSNIKHCNRLEQILARSDLSADECIMLDDNDCVISVTQGNIFAIKHRVLLTPNLDKCGIAGTRRAMVLKIAGELGLQVRIESLILQELLECDEVFITNSVIGIKTVASIGEKFFTQQIITQKLIQIFKKIK